MKSLGKLLVAALAVAFAAPTKAGVLPEDRADIMYHSYSGDNVTIDGPSFLMRKKFLKNFSASANYYVDMVTSASIDVVTTASEYTEERTQFSGGIDYLRGKTMMSLGYSHSEENDYLAQNLSFTVSQDIFGDLTTVSMGYSYGWDEVGQSTDPTFEDQVRRQSYRLGVSQILTKSIIMGMSFETITDEGYLNNPYRTVRYLDPTDLGRGYSYEQEVYPRTRTSNAGAVRLKYFLPYRAALHGEYRFHADTWGIDGHTGEIGYTHPTDSGFIFEVKYRHYTQTKADFFSDLFPRRQAQNFLARDKELSGLTSHTVRFGVTYEFAKGGWHFVDKGSVNLFYDFIRFDYDDFRDLRDTSFAPGTEPFFSFDADVIQAFVSFWF